MELVEEFLRSKGLLNESEGMSDQEFSSLRDVINRLPLSIGTTPIKIGIDVRDKKVWDEIRSKSFDEALEDLAEKIEDFFQSHPREKSFYGNFTEDGEYIPFSAQDFYKLGLIS